LQQLAADQSRTQPQPQPVASRERSISEPQLEQVNHNGIISVSC
jgi:hypothetical protein